MPAALTTNFVFPAGIGDGKRVSFLFSAGYEQLRRDGLPGRFTCVIYLFFPFLQPQPQRHCGRRTWRIALGPAQHHEPPSIFTGLDLLDAVSNDRRTGDIVVDGDAQGSAQACAVVAGGVGPLLAFFFWMLLTTAAAFYVDESFDQLVKA